MSQLTSPPPPTERTPSRRSTDISTDTSTGVSVAEPSINEAATETIVLDIEGMMCAGCVGTVEKKLAQCEGVVRAQVNLVTEIAAVDYVPTTDPQAIAQALSDAGYPSEVRQSNDSAGSTGLQAETDWLERKEAEQKDQANQIAIAGTLLLLSPLGHLQHLSFLANSRFSNWLEVPILSTLWFHGMLATLTLIFPARKILIEGVQGIRRRSPNMNTLVSLGALSAYFTSIAALVFPNLGWDCFFDEPVMLLSFILIGRSLEQRARFRAASSLRSLIALQPALARLTEAPTKNKPDSSWQTESITGSTDVSMDVSIPTSQVRIGDWLRVLPGEKVPVDGTIALGKTSLNEAMITGESIPVVKGIGDEVTAGTLNQSGAITLQVSRTGADTTLGQMIQLVETAQTRKAPVQGFADLISSYFTYGVLVCAALTFCFWYFVGVSVWPEVASAAMGHIHHMAGPHMAGQHMAGQMAASANGSLRLLVSLKLTIAVIVVACPCALGLATPTAILVGSGIGAEKGLLIRGGDILEETHKLDTLVFDKTGTLTTGKPHVTNCLPLGADISEDQLLQIAATVEKGTQHPLAIAIQQAAEDKQLPVLSAEQFYTEAGLGVSAMLANAEASDDVDMPTYLGKEAWMVQNGTVVEPEVAAIADKLANDGKTVVFVGQNQRLIGLIGVLDTLRPEAVETVEALQSMGVQVKILSGDRKAAVGAIAQQLHLTPAQTKAEVSPQGKLNAISQLQAAGHCVGVVGDGINDAPALSQANVGIALNSGTEVAMETADIVLMGNRLTDVIAAIQLSQNTFNTIRQNLAWAFGYNLVCIPLAAGAVLPAFGLSLNPGFAGGLMALSSVTVVVNSLLLRRKAK